jgi:hypothetical protein
MLFIDFKNRIAIMRNKTLAVTMFATVATLAGCDVVDPTNVTNPTVTEETFLGTPNAAASWARGVERQLAVTVRQHVQQPDALQ